MTAPKKPRSAAGLKPAPAPPLTVDQQLLLKYYAEICDESQQHILRMMALATKSCPRHVRPALRLVGGVK
ncbi:hypothetical protein SAMN05428959_10823 [Duganella sp. CF517]|uniref:hypothetical protein n=1 Tax=Duganella sp. CF517 TaxID=1881038 RepID=UPI0008BE6DFB|nr:hypothetical protein [Duganella sp. CF517]SEO43929.1 hypothetical protein SAMN05428959_10823 [Duganella sp. CF517]